MSALTYYLSSKARQLCIPLLVLTLLPLSFAQAAEKPAAPASTQAEETAPSTGNSSHAPSIPAAQKEAAQKEAAQKEAANAEATPQAAAKNSAENTATSSEAEQEATQPALPESQSASAKYLRTFDHSNKRCPFSKMVDSDAPVADTTWYSDAPENEEDDDQERKPEDFRFDGRNKPNLASYARLPLIKVTGLIQVGGKRAVSANIQNKGVCILYENDNVVIEANAKTNLSKSVTIKKIHLNGMTVILDDGNEITGKFY